MDNNVWKIFLTFALTTYWQKYYPNCHMVTIKPIQSSIGNQKTYQQLFNLNQSSEEIKPLFLPYISKNHWLLLW